MADVAENARMEAHIAKVAAVGPKWEKAVDKLRKEFPDDLTEVYKRVKAMVSQSKSKGKSSDTRSASVAIPASASASSSRPSRKETKRPITPPPEALRRKDKDIRDMMLTLPVEKKALEDLSDEMTRDVRPDLRASSSTITSSTSDKSKDDRFALPSNERISLDGMDMTQGWNLPENLQDIFAMIDTPTYEEEQKEKKRSSELQEDSMPELKKQAASPCTNNVAVNADARAVEIKLSHTQEAKKTEDAVMAEDESKPPTNDLLQAGHGTMLQLKEQAPPAAVVSGGDTEMMTTEEDRVTPLEHTSSVTAGTQGNGTDSKTGIAANLKNPNSFIETVSVKAEITDTKPAVIEAIKSSAAENAKAKQSQFDDIKDIHLSKLQIDSRILAHLAKEGITSTGYIMLRGIREEDIRYIIEAIAKAEGVGIVDGVLAVRRIEEAYHLFQQQCLTHKQ